MTTPTDSEHELPTRRPGPGRPRLDKQDGGEVRERLLEAATALAVEQGFEASGLREIAARAQVSPAMIAYYFGDREGLHEAMFQRAFDRLTEQVRTLIEQERREGDDQDEGDRLDELVRIHVSALAADPWLPKLIVRDVLASPDAPLRKRPAEWLARGPIRPIVRWLEEEQTRGLLRADLDPRLMAISIASLSGFPFLMLPLAGEQLGIELDDAFAARLIEHNQRLLARGLRARPKEDR